MSGLTCPNCAAPLDSGSAFCPRCGNPIPATTAVEDATVRSGPTTTPAAGGVAASLKSAWARYDGALKARWPRGRWAIHGVTGLLVLGLISAPFSDRSSATGADAEVSPTPTLAPSTMADAGILRIVAPADGVTVETASIAVSGTAPIGAVVTRDIDGGFDQHVTASDGTWTMVLDLKDGANEIVLRLGDDTSTAQTLHVTYHAVAAVPTSTPTPTALPSPTEAPTATPEPTDEATATPEPTEEPTPEPTVAPAPKIVYETLSDRGWAKLVKSPDDYLGETYKVWACITQFDAATGDDTFRADASNKKRTYWGLDGDNAIFTGDSTDLADFVEDDVVVMNVMSAGSISYDTQIGGNTTVPAFLVSKITRKGSCD